MRLAIITTTIRVPVQLASFLSADTDLFIAGDRKSPHDEIEAWAKRQPGTVTYLRPDEQAARWPVLSTVVGWNTIQRRNFALLAAIEWMPRDCVGLLTLDDDHIWTDAESDPVSTAWYFVEKQASDDAIYLVYPGLFNPGCLALLEEKFYARGFPISARNHAALGSLETQGHASLSPAIVQYSISGDPDIAALDRLALGRQLQSRRTRPGTLVMTDPRNTLAPINSQATLYRDSLAPLACVLPGIGRYDDIWGGYLAQAVLGQMDAGGVLFGELAMHHERNEHNLLDNLADELHGMRHTEAFLTALINVPAAPVGLTSAERLSWFATHLAITLGPDVWPDQTREFLNAWCGTLEAIKGRVTAVPA